MNRLQFIFSAFLALFGRILPDWRTTQEEHRQLVADERELRGDDLPPVDYYFVSEKDASSYEKKTGRYMPIRVRWQDGVMIPLEMGFMVPLPFERVGKWWVRSWRSILNIERRGT